MSDPHLALAGISVARGGRPVLDRVDLTIGRGDVVALTGPSGSGKSTLLRVIVGLEAPSAGTVSLRGVRVSAAGAVLVPPNQRSVAIVFQDLALWPHLTVAGNLAFGLAAAGVSRTERESRLQQALAAVGVADLAARSPGDLSGGERQRAALARALVLRPDTLLLDEPLASLDLLRRSEVIELLRALIDQHSLTVVLVTHSLRELSSVATRLVALEDGRVTQDAPLREALAAPATPFVTALARDLA